MPRSSPRRVAKAIVPSAVIGRLNRKRESMRSPAQHQRARARRLASAPTEFERAYAEYWRTGVVPPEAGELLFLATWASGGDLPRSLSRRHAPAFDATTYAGFPSELLNGLNPAAVAGGLEREGYYVAPFALASSAVDDISRMLNEGPATPRGDAIEALAPGPPTQTAPSWWAEPTDALRSSAVRRLMRERKLAETAGTYLGVDPLIMSLALWKSFAWESTDDHSAQLFHYDNDRSSFVKIFVYLTDVGPDNGPHTYVPRSHRSKPKELLHGGRLPDDLIAESYPRDSWATITGARGTVFFADTQGFHKGERVAEGAREIFQINLGSDHFGAPGSTVGPATDAPSDLAAAVAQAPRYFGQLFSADAPVA